jgi:hypothetical protein
MITNRIYLPEIVSDSIEHGFAPIPVHYKSKQPINKRWTELYLKTISGRISMSILSILAF